MRGGERQNRGGEERGVQQTERKGKSRPLPRQRDQGLGGLDRIGNVTLAGNIQGGGGGDDNEEYDDHATDAADKNIGARLRILAGADFLFDEPGLEVEKLPGGNRRSD